MSARDFEMYRSKRIERRISGMSVTVQEVSQGKAMEITSDDK
jgi:hypothetical protein